MFGLLALIAAVAPPVAAHADEPKARVSFGAAVTAGAIDGSAAWSGSAGYRFADHLSFDVEVTAVDQPADRFDNRHFAFGSQGPGGMAGMARVGNIVASRGSQPGSPQRGQFGPALDTRLVMAPDFPSRTDGKTLLATMGFRYELPSGDARFKPYVSGGFGISRTDETFHVGIATPAPAAPNRGGMAAPISNVTIDQNASHTGLLGGAGAGASLRIVKQLSIDVDARYYRLDRGRNLGRFGGGLSYRF